MRKPAAPLDRNARTLQSARLRPTHARTANSAQGGGGRAHPGAERAGLPPGGWCPQGGRDQFAGSRIHVVHDRLKVPGAYQASQVIASIGHTAVVHGWPHQPAPRRATTANPHSRSDSGHPPEPTADRNHPSRFSSERQTHDGDCARSGRYGQASQPTAISRNQTATLPSGAPPPTPLSRMKAMRPADYGDPARRCAKSLCPFHSVTPRTVRAWRGSQAHCHSAAAMWVCPEARSAPTARFLRPARICGAEPVRSSEASSLQAVSRIQ